MGYRSAVAVAGLALGGCTGATPGDEPLAQIDTLANGAVRVTSLGEGAWASGEGAPWSLVEELRIGSLDGEQDSFARIGALEVLPDGRIYVLDRTPLGIKVFDRDGTYLATFSREGDGPGELRTPVSLNADPTGSLWVADVAADRFTVFTPDGALVDTYRYAAAEIVGRGDFAGDGRFHDLSFRRLLVLDDDLQPGETIPMPPFEAEYFPPPPRSTSGGFTMSARRPVPFTARQTYALHPDGSLWVGVSDDYAIHRLGSTGDTVRVIRRDGVEPHRVGAEERAEAEEPLQALMERGADIDLARIPERKPLYSRFLFADDGHLWVQLETEDGFEGQRWDVFDPSGVYLGAVTTELDLGIVIVEGDEMFGVAADELGVEYVVRLRVVGR